MKMWINASNLPAIQGSCADLWPHWLHCLSLWRIEYIYNRTRWSTHTCTHKIVFSCKRGPPIVSRSKNFFATALCFVHVFQPWTFPKPWTLLYSFVIGPCLNVYTYSHNHKGPPWFNKFPPYKLLWSVLRDGLAPFSQWPQMLLVWPFHMDLLRFEQRQNYWRKTWTNGARCSTNWAIQPYIGGLPISQYSSVGGVPFC